MSRQDRSAGNHIARLRRHGRIAFYGRTLCLCGALFAALCAISWTSKTGWRASTGRQLLSSASCDKDELHQWQKQGGVVLYFVGVLYLFLGIAIVCDTFFEPSLQAISDALGLSADVAGATFMAAGSSAPELFSSIVALTNPSAGEDLGVGTIVGSAVFNILMIVGATGLFAGRTLELDWKPLVRDATFYGCSVIAVIAAFLNKEVHWYEGLAFVIAYCGYILFMVYNSQMFAWMDSMVALKVTQDPSVNPMALAPTHVDMEGQRTEHGDILGARAVHIGGPDEPTKRTTGDGPDDNDADDDDPDFDFLHVPDRWKERPMWILSWPWYAVYGITIPQCASAHWASWYPLTFTMCIAWIMLISWYMVEWVATAGCVLGVPDVVMGVTVLAAGTSVPDCLSSIAVAKKGLGDMAIANAVGSNVFDILLGLGAPWMVILAVQNRTLKPNTSDLVPSVLILLGVLALYFGSIAFHGWRMTRQTAYVLIFAYVLYALYNIVCVWQLDIYNSS